MKGLAAVLLIGVFFRHTAATWLGETSYTYGAWFYILGGMWEVVLCGVLLVILLGAKASIWRNLALIAMAIGVSEGLQISVCRLAISNISLVPKWEPLCDYVTGLPIGAMFMALYIIALCYGTLKRK